jgi:hypothetical protein
VVEEDDGVSGVEAEELDAVDERLQPRSLDAGTNSSFVACATAS